LLTAMTSKPNISNITLLKKTTSLKHLFISEM
jgi:hypothetical protein